MGRSEHKKSTENKMPATIPRTLRDGQLGVGFWKMATFAWHNLWPAPYNNWIQRISKYNNETSVAGKRQASKRKLLDPIAEAVGPKVSKKIPPSTQVPAKPKLNNFTTDYTGMNFETPTLKEWNFKISSWNVAGLRALIQKDGMEFIKKEDPDIMCLQVCPTYNNIGRIKKKTLKLGNKMSVGRGSSWSTNWRLPQILAWKERR